MPKLPPHLASAVGCQLALAVEGVAFEARRIQSFEPVGGSRSRLEDQDAWVLWDGANPVGYGFNVL